MSWSFLFQDTLIVWLAAILCMVAIFFEVIRISLNREGLISPFISSPLYLPLYFGGIFQWFLFGIYLLDYALLVTCSIQLILLAKIFPQYWRYHTK